MKSNWVTPVNFSKSYRSKLLARSRAPKPPKMLKAFNRLFAPPTSCEKRLFDISPSNDDKRHNYAVSFLHEQGQLGQQLQKYISAKRGTRDATHSFDDGAPFVLPGLCRGQASLGFRFTHRAGALGLEGPAERCPQEPHRGHR